MTIHKPLRSKRETLRRLFLLLLFCLILWIMLFGCHVEILQPQKLAQAKNLWDSKSPNHYEQVFIVTGFCGFPCSNEVKMGVMNNQIVKASARGSILPSDAPFIPVTQEQMLSANLQNYTVNALFQQADSALQKIGIIAFQSGSDRVYHLDYDPELGFISRYEVDDCGQGGLLIGGIGDCRWGVIVKSVILID